VIHYPLSLELIQEYVLHKLNKFIIKLTILSTLFQI